MTLSHATGEFTIEQLFGSKTRARLLQLFLQNPETAYFVRELTRKIDAQLNSVRRELSNLVALGIVIEQVVDSEAQGRADRKKYYQVSATHPLFEELRSLFVKAGTLMQQDMVRMLARDLPIQVMVLTGSFVGNRDIETDMLIVGTPDPKMLQERMAAIEGAVGSEVNYTVMPPDEYLYRKEISDRFLCEILQGDHVMIHDALS